MRKHLNTIALLGLIFAILLTCPAQAKMTQAVVVYVDSNYIVLGTKNGFTVAELYGGYYALDEDDVVIGEVESYGFTDLYCPATDRQARVYVDNYWLTAQRAAEWLAQKKR
jgi:hypothetical protein